MTEQRSEPFLFGWLNPIRDMRIGLELELANERWQQVRDCGGIACANTGCIAFAVEKDYEGWGVMRNIRHPFNDFCTCDTSVDPYRPQGEDAAPNSPAELQSRERSIDTLESPLLADNGQ